MKEIKKLFVTDGGYILLKDEDGNYHSLENFTDAETGEIITKAFRGEVKPLNN
jgi:hypothetical protein